MSNQINKGDRLLCKKDCISKYSLFIKNEYYYIDTIDINDDEENFYFVIDNCNSLSWFWGDYNLYSVFYTKKEIRKIKLNSIYYESL